ncbi:MAG: response regulator transcription factor [Actinomycetota bacterium]|nr:response regulator transcription factor [Actinomycetota bacterium]
MVTLLICAGAPETRSALERTALGVPGLVRVRSAGDVLEAGAAVRRHPTDVVLLDAQLPGAGPEAVRRLVTGEGAPRVFMLGSRDDYAAVALALAAGASGFVRPDLSSAELAALLAHALTGQRRGGAVPPDRVVGGLVPVQRPILTEREVQVLRGMSDGRSNAEIGRGLYLSEDTVKTHAQRLFRKLGVNDRAHAVASGFRLGVLS